MDWDRILSEIQDNHLTAKMIYMIDFDESAIPWGEQDYKITYDKITGRILRRSVE